MDGTGRTNGHALAAKLALRIVNVCHIVLNHNGIVRAVLGTEAATYAGSLAGLAGNGSLVPVDAGHINPEAADSLAPELDNALRTSLCTGPAGNAPALVHNRKSGLLIHRDGTELAGLHAVSAAETAECASGVAGIKRSLDLAGLVSVVVIGLRPVGAASVATDDSHHRSLLRHFITENGGYLLHDVVSAYRAEIGAEVRSLDGGLGESAAARESATAAIGARHHLLHLVNPWIFFYLEPFGNKVQDNRQDQSQNGDYHYCPNNC